jgi:hypothetical protein
MTEQRTPDELTAENELICEKLLGWTPCLRRITDGAREWKTQESKYFLTPSFTTWADAGLILDALPKELEYIVGYCDIEKQWYCGQAVGADTYADTGPLAVRAAALEYIRSLP